MFKHLARSVTAALISGIAIHASIGRAEAQSYPIDCAILLCLSGGWPASAPCSRARAEFIRRITPWPVEPPLQIWRCPMAASQSLEPPDNERGRIYDILLKGVPPTPLQSAWEATTVGSGAIWPEKVQSAGLSERAVRKGSLLRFVQDRADVDISGPEFDFVRSIRVFDVRFARQFESDVDEDCNRFASVYLGSYGIQGEFGWRRVEPSALPDAHVGLELWGEVCPSILHRSVFVEWSDARGGYGFEQVNY